MLFAVSPLEMRVREMLSTAYDQSKTFTEMSVLRMFVKEYFYALSVEQICRRLNVDVVDNPYYEREQIAGALKQLVRRKVLRSRLSPARERLYEINFSDEDVNA